LKKGYEFIFIEINFCSYILKDELKTAVLPFFRAIVIYFFRFEKRNQRLRAIMYFLVKFKELKGRG